jgi:hypothetical protein
MRWIVVAAALMLGGCNLVVTPRPLFSAADQAPGALPRSGVWRTAAKPDCAFDPAKPLGEWPECAGGVALQADGRARYYDHAAKPPAWKTQSLLFLPGSPMIGQVEVTVVGATLPVGDKPYAYVGVRPARTDEARRIVAMRVWPVQCGPPAPGDTLSLTKSLLPGLTAKRGEIACTTTDVAALRAAAAASEAWAPEPMRGEWAWVRDGDN